MTTLIDTTWWDRKEEMARRMTDAELAWARRDAYEASRAVAGHDPVAEGRYLDEAGIYAAEQKRRA